MAVRQGASGPCLLFGDRRSTPGIPSRQEQIWNKKAWIILVSSEVFLKFCNHQSFLCRYMVKCGEDWSWVLCKGRRRGQNCFVMESDCIPFGICRTRSLLVLSKCWQKPLCFSLVTQRSVIIYIDWFRRESPVMFVRRNPSAAIAENTFFLRLRSPRWAVYLQCDGATGSVKQRGWICKT